MTSYYLTVDGMDGGDLSVRHKGAFDVKDFVFDVANEIALAGSGAGTGKAVVAPLLLDLEPGSFLNGLLKSAVLGTHIKSVELKSDNGQGQAAYDLRLGDVLVTKVTDTSGVDKLQLSFSKFSLTERTQTATGSMAPADTFSFDLKTFTAGSSPLVAAVAGNVGGSAGVADYFLHVDGLAGTTTADKFKGDFDANSFNFNIANLISTVGGGAGTGKATLSPLTVNLENGSPLNGFLKLAALGKHVPLVELKGVNPELKLVYDLKLTDATVSRVTNGAVQEKVQFQYAKIQLITHEVNSDGSLAPAQVFSWNFKTNSTALVQVAKSGAAPFDFSAFETTPVAHVAAPVTFAHDGEGGGSGTPAWHVPLEFGFGHDFLS